MFVNCIYMMMIWKVKLQLLARKGDVVEMQLMQEEREYVIIAGEKVYVQQPVCTFHEFEIWLKYTIKKTSYKSIIMAIFLFCDENT